MREGDLYVKGHGDQVAGQEENGPCLPGRNGAPEDDIEVQEDVGADASDLDVPRPPCLALGARAGGNQVDP